MTDRGPAPDDVLPADSPFLGAETLVGLPVETPEGEARGHLAEVLVDLRTGAVRGLVIALGGFLHLGERHVTLAWDDLAWDLAEGRLVPRSYKARTALLGSAERRDSSSHS